MNNKRKKPRLKSIVRENIRAVGVVKDNVVEREKIISALNDERYSVRIFPGIAKQFGVNERDIVKIFKSDEYLLHKAKILRRKSASGDYLITTKARFSKTASFMDRFIDIFSTKRVDIGDV
ncbi:hypothetical protein [Cobetia sp. L2A1]|uniref:hypothetical protein n=1 Tax=Cobetia sp. L2A1 TaxID=2686360 RepID=UPI00131E45C0|nr:hypothetical protein [Cobetia sp. L2A1]